MRPWHGAHSDEWSPHDPSQTEYLRCLSSHWDRDWNDWGWLLFRHLNFSSRSHYYCCAIARCPRLCLSIFPVSSWMLVSWFLCGLKCLWDQCFRPHFLCLFSLLVLFFVEFICVGQIYNIIVEFWHASIMKTSLIIIEPNHQPYNTLLITLPGVIGDLFLAHFCKKQIAFVFYFLFFFLLLLLVFCSSPLDALPSSTKSRWARKSAASANIQHDLIWLLVKNDVEVSWETVQYSMMYSTREWVEKQLGIKQSWA